tara:strand:+ start:2207 stop:3874 length:1668 start_codon:yes stop_codon:yes gene_type:complete
MKKLNEAQMIIFEEESARAIMLKKAKESLNEAEYQGLVALLPEYESRAELSKVSRIDLYELIYEEAEKAKDPAKQGIFGSILQGLRGKAQNFRDRNMSAEQIRAELRRILEDEATKKLFSTLEGYKEKTADELANDPNYQGMKRNVDAFVLRTNMLYNQLASLEPGTKAINNAETLVKVAETLGMDPKDLLAGYKVISGSSTSKKSKLPPEDQAYVDFRKPGTGGGGRTGGDGDGGGDKPDDKPEEKSPEEKPEEKSPESKKPITVRSVQRPIINLVQRTAAAQGVDVTVKQAQEIAITITKNLVNQMRANGVEFKGVSKDLKESVIGEIELELLEAKLVKQTASLMDPEKWMTLAKAAIKKFQDLGFTNKKVIRQMKDTDNDDNFVDMYDLYLDLRKIRTAGGKALKAADEESKEEFKELRKSINTRITQMQIYSEFSEPEEGRKYKKRYVQAKKKMKISGDKDRIAGEKARKEDGVDVKDMSMAKPEAGKINISQTVGRAIQKGGLGKDVAKKITPILMKKIKKIIDKNVEGDVKYLEEKINRYVRSVIKEIK